MKNQEETMLGFGISTSSNQKRPKRFLHFGRFYGAIAIYLNGSAKRLEAKLSLSVKV